MKAILFLAVIFIIVSCEKTEMIDSKIETGKCHTGYIINVLNDSRMKYLVVFNIEKESEMTIEIRKIKKVQ